MNYIKTFEDFINEGKSDDSLDNLDESNEKLVDRIYLALETIEEFKRLGMDQQGQLTMMIVKKFGSYGIK